MTDEKGHIIVPETNIPGLVLAEDVEEAREELNKNRDPKIIVAQHGGQEKALASNAQIKVFGGKRGGGKPLIDSTLVVTPFGYKPIGALKKGDIIIGRDGKFQRVVYNVHKGMLPCYEFTFIDGSKVISSYDHAWTVRRTCYIPKRRHLNNLSLEESWEVTTTEDIVEFLRKKESGEIKNGNIVIPVCEPVHFTTNAKYRNKPTIDPYIIGALIGDGCVTDTVINNTSVRFTSADDEIVNEFVKAGYDMSHIVKKKTSSKCNDYVIRDEELIETIKSIGLAGHSAYDKFIPDCYKWGTVEERFAIVQGIMDTDGYIDDRGHCELVTTSKQLAEDMKFMISSLGGLATMSVKEKSGYKDKNGNFVQCRPAYRLYIKMPDATKIFRLTRKKERMAQFNGGISEFTRRIVKAEYVGEKPCCCIRVSNPDSLFLVEDFIVTHNTYYLLCNNTYLAETATNARMLILRTAIDDLSDIIDTSYEIYRELGDFKKNDMRWDFQQGSYLAFNYHGGSYEDFCGRFRGRQYCKIGIDEATLMSFDKFKFIITCLRNAYGYANEMILTCNPDPDSWMLPFIDWWIDEAGDPIPERDGVVRYAFLDGDTPQTIVWGDSREEVYQKCKGLIDSLWSKDMEQYGDPKDIFIKSVTFIGAELTDNKALMQSDPSYISNLAGQSEEQRARDFGGNWRRKVSGEDMIHEEDMLNFYSNAEQLGDHRRRASCDAAFDGGDNLVMYLWIGYHIADIAVCRKDSKDTVSFVRAKLREWQVMEEDFTYDLNGVGQTFKGFFRRAIPFNNRESPDEDFKAVYDTIKSQAAYTLVQLFRDKRISIDPRLLERRYSGHGFTALPLRNILLKERKAIRANDQRADHGFSLIKKPDMKKIVGHSPDFIEGMMMRTIFDIKRPHHAPSGISSAAKGKVLFSRRRRLR